MSLSSQPSEVILKVMGHLEDGEVATLAATETQLTADVDSYYARKLALQRLQWQLLLPKEPLHSPDASPKGIYSIQERYLRKHGVRTFPFTEEEEVAWRAALASLTAPPSYPVAMTSEHEERWAEREQYWTELTLDLIANDDLAETVTANPDDYANYVPDSRSQVAVCTEDYLTCLRVLANDSSRAKNTEVNKSLVALWLTRIATGYDLRDLHLCTLLVRIGGATTDVGVLPWEVSSSVYSVYNLPVLTRMLYNVGYPFKTTIRYDNGQQRSLAAYCTLSITSYFWMLTREVNDGRSISPIPSTAFLTVVETCLLALRGSLTYIQTDITMHLVRPLFHYESYQVQLPEWTKLVRSIFVLLLPLYHSQYLEHIMIRDYLAQSQEVANTNQSTSPASVSTSK